ncbi:MAG: outer membrane beta-barrel family protein, partial [Bacteroidales bacterium]|nr:outer membrane beta-barrel family protein [Bacteroidales bacterium]
MDIDIATNTYYSHSVGEYKGMEILNHGWTNNSNISLTFKPIRGMNLQLQYFIVTPQYFAQFTTKTIHYCNIGIKQTFWKNRITVAGLLTDGCNTRRWDTYADNTIYSLGNTSKNRSRMFWLGVTFNINSFKPQAGKKQQEEDRNMIRIGE